MRDNPLFTVADGLIWLWQVTERNSVVRKLQVIKLRGQDSVPGLHTIRIGDGGLQAFSRTLGLVGAKTNPVRRRRLSIGIPLLGLVSIGFAGYHLWCRPIVLRPGVYRIKEAEAMTAAVEKAGVPNMVWYNYRRVPAVTFAKQLVDEGKLGRVYHYRAKFLQDWTISPELPQGGAGLWRLDAAAAGSGVTGDLLAHCIDTATWLNGPIDSVCAMTETFVKERKHNLTGRVEKVGIDDACAFLCRFANGSLATFESTRYARGHKALYTFEINGEHASIGWDLHDLHRLQYFEHRDEGKLRGWRSIHVTDGDHPYMGKWWVPGLQIGYEHSFTHQVADFLEGLGKGESVSPTFRDALATQFVCDAVLQSAREGKWVNVEK
jgi:predicted dehydrogenase